MSDGNRPGLPAAGESGPRVPLPQASRPVPEAARLGQPDAAGPAGQAQAAGGAARPARAPRVQAGSARAPRVQAGPAQAPRVEAGPAEAPPEEEWPAAADNLPPRSRGVIALLEENCTVCMLCARECPDWCIYIEGHKEPVPSAAPLAGAGEAGAGARGRPRMRNALDRFAIDFSLCMYCGICVEVCPYDALFWSPEYSYSATSVAELTHERDRLREWMWTVPPPPAHDRGAPPPREALTASPGTAPGKSAD